MLKLKPITETSQRYNIKVKRIGHKQEIIIHTDVDCMQGQQIAQKEQQEYGDQYTVWLEPIIVPQIYILPESAVEFLRTTQQRLSREDNDTAKSCAVSIKMALDTATQHNKEDIVIPKA